MCAAKSEPTSFVRPRNLFRKLVIASLTAWRQTFSRPQMLLVALVALAASLATTSAAPPQLQLRGQPGKIYTIEASADLQNWVAIASTQADATGRMSFSDPQAGNFKQRY